MTGPGTRQETHNGDKTVKADKDRLSVVEKAVFLQNVDIFSQTKTEDLARIAAITEEMTFERDATIFEEQERGASLYFIISGEVSLRKAEREVNRVYSQGNFGDLSFLDNKPREFSAIAIKSTHVLKIDSDEFYDLIEDHIEITRAVFNSLTQRIRQLLRG